MCEGSTESSYLGEAKTVKAAEDVDLRAFLQTPAGKRAYNSSKTETRKMDWMNIRRADKDWPPLAR